MRTVRNAPPRFRAALVLAALAAAGLASPPRPALAWGRNGHRASARLAESRLTPEAKALVRELLDEGESLADASTWADEHGRDVPGSARWHFVNVPIDAGRYADRFCRDACVVSKFHEFYNVLTDRSAPRPRRRMALRYVVHLVQDAHQPMHVGDDHDRGGNDLQLVFFRDDPTNLHQVWDSGLLRQGFRNERAVADALFDRARQADAQTWIAGNIEDWVDESLTAARNAYQAPGGKARLRRGARLGEEYQERHLPVAVRRLAQAGVRLSDVLNSAAQPSRTPSKP